jgi:orotate phosphoribosyltransferase
MHDLTSAKSRLKEAIRKFSYRENHEQPFTLASGKKSPYYFDLKQTLLQPEYLALAGKIVAGMIAAHYKGSVVAAGLTMGADPIIYAACLAHGCAGVDGGQDALFAGDLAHGCAGVDGGQEALFAGDLAHGCAGVDGGQDALFAGDLAHGCAGVDGGHDALFAGDLAHGCAGVDGGQDALFKGELAATRLATVIAEAPTKILPAIVRKEAKDHGTGKKIEMLKGIDTTTPCVMIDDVITTAGSTLKALAAMREAGFSVRHAICILDRGEGGREALLSHGVELLPVFTAAEFRAI